MQVKSIANTSAFIKLPFVIKIFVLSNFERPFYTGFTVLKICLTAYNAKVMFYFLWRVFTFNIMIAYVHIWHNDC